MPNKRVLLTGATGFVGRQVLKALQNTDTNLLLVIRNGKEGCIENRNKIEKVITTPDLFMESEAWWAKHFQDVDLVIHAAWYAKPGDYLNSPINMDCLIGSLTMAKAVVSAGVKRYVGIGTCHEYDLSDEKLTENTPLKPLSVYASAKASLYLALSQWFPQKKIQFAWCRLFYLYGEGEDEHRLLPYIRKQIEKSEFVNLTSGEQVRDFIDVADAGKIIAKVGIGSQQGAINICSGLPLSIRNIAERIAAEYNRHDLLRFGTRQLYCVDPPRIIGTPNYE